MRRCAAAHKSRDYPLTTTLDHQRLLTLARKAYAAAGDADVERLADDLSSFVHILAAHFDHEIPLLIRVPPAEARLVRQGQARVSAAARTLLEDAESGCGGHPQRCASRAEELLALLTLQARDERLALLAASVAEAAFAGEPGR
ncbi:MAG: hypothetical protein ACRDVW_09495 [Acidimicrobiales bacterium]